MTSYYFKYNQLICNLILYFCKHALRFPLRMTAYCTDSELINTFSFLNCCSWIYEKGLTSAAEIKAFIRATSDISPPWQEITVWMRTDLFPHSLISSVTQQVEQSVQHFPRLKCCFYACWVLLSSSSSWWSVCHTDTKLTVRNSSKKPYQCLYRLVTK